MVAGNPPEPIVIVYVSGLISASFIYMTPPLPPPPPKLPPPPPPPPIINMSHLVLLFTIIFDEEVIGT